MTLPCRRATCGGMGITTILVHLADDPDHLGRLRAAYELAKLHGAHLDALYVLRPPGMPYAIEGRGASAGFLRQSLEAQRERLEAVRAEFGRWLEDHDIPSTWISEEGSDLELLARHSHTADLAVVSQSEPGSLEDMIFNELPDHLAMQGSCPTIVLPHLYGGAGPLGRKVLIAWNDDRPGARAVRDALPLLAKAETVLALTVEGKDGERADTDRLRTWLGRHGIACQPLRARREGRTVATAILDAATQHVCDLVVMGGYGRSRLQELVLGGTTQAMLAGAPVPVLMSH